MFTIEYADLSKLNLIEQMHDELINEIEYNSSTLILKFNELHFQHFNKLYSRAEMIFSDIQDINSDISLELYAMNGLKIDCGEKIYLDDFFNRFPKGITIEVLDIFLGYENFLIYGNLLDTGHIEYNKIRLLINSKNLKYCFN